MAFTEKHPLLAAFWGICLLRQGPQILPASGFLLGLTVALSMLVSVIGLMFTHGLLYSLWRAAAEVAPYMALAYLIMLIAGRKARAAQTLTAIAGSGALINFLSLPFLWVVTQTDDTSGWPGTILVLTLFWQVTVLGGIYRSALSVGWGAGLVVAVGYIGALYAVYSFFLAR